MKKSLFFFIALLAALIAPAQDTDYYKELMQQADRHWEKGEFEKALNYLAAAREYRPDSAAVVDEKLVFFTKEIAKKYKEAREQKTKADNATAKAQQQARTAYAKDLVYKSKIALRDGDRNTAFRLAEFAHRYVEADNTMVVQALMDALYYNDDSSHPPLPRVMNLEGNFPWVNNITFSPDGKWLVTAADDVTEIWDVRSGKAVLTLNTSATCIAFSPDGKWLATTNSSIADKTAKIWDLQTGKNEITLEGHSKEIASLAFSPDGKRLATGSRDGTAKIWDLQTGKNEITLEGNTNKIKSLAFSPDGKWLATMSIDGTIRIWEFQNGEFIYAQRTSQDEDVIAFSADSNHLITYGLKTAKTWNLFPVTNSSNDSSNLIRHWPIITDKVEKVLLSPDGKILAIGFYDHKVQIWDLEFGKNQFTLIGHIPVPAYVNTEGQEPPFCIAFSPDGKYLSTASWQDGTVKIWDLYSGPAAPVLQHSANGDITFSPDGKRFTMGAVENISKLWDLDKSKNLIPLQNTTEDIILSPDGKRLAVVRDDHTLVIRSLETGKVIDSLYDNEIRLRVRCAFSPDGKRLAFSSSRHGMNLVNVCNLQSSKVIAIECGGYYGVSDLDFSPDGRHIAIANISAEGDNTSSIWDSENGKRILTLEDGIAGVAFSPDGKRLATGSSYNPVKIWDMESGKVINTIEGHEGVEEVAFSTDGKLLATTGGTKYELASDGMHYHLNKTIKIWELSGDGLIRRWQETGKQAELIHQQIEQYNLEGLPYQRPK